MGYSTRYGLTMDHEFDVEQVDLVQKAIEACRAVGADPPDKLKATLMTPGNLAFLELRKCEGAIYALGEDLDGGESCKWYDHETDMQAVSKAVPEVLFTLEGKGEDAGDIWKKYFRNGRMQVCKATIMFDEFDPKKLK